METRKLTQEQKEHYSDRGFVTGLPVFGGEELAELNEGFRQLASLLAPGEQTFAINGWHRTSRWLYDVCTHPQILQYVEDILGPDFFLWGSHFFTKAPRSADTVEWHQDAPYWPLTPHNAVTVWLAFVDADEENGAMRVVPGTHKGGLLRHSDNSSDSNVLNRMLEPDEGAFRESEAVTLSLRAGEVSLHDDALVHGSPANLSERWRIGLTIRYSGTNVKCDTNVWQGFTVYTVRGVDAYGHNPEGTVPVERFARS